MKSGFHCMTFATAALVVGLLGLESNAVAQAIVRAEVVEGDPTAPDSTFRVRVAMVQNNTGRRPAAYALNVRFDDRAIDAGSIEVSGSSLGSATMSSVEGSGSNASFNVGTLGNLNNNNPTPEFFTLEMTTLSEPRFPYSIEVRDSAAGDQSIPSTQIFPPQFVAHVFDNTAVTNICDITCQIPVVVAALLGEQPSTSAEDLNGDGVVDAADLVRTP